MNWMRITHDKIINLDRYNSITLDGDLVVISRGNDYKKKLSAVSSTPQSTHHHIFISIRDISEEFRGFLIDLRLVSLP
jgi:hypothetical protein